jgi:hypothetical protein
MVNISTSPLWQPQHDRQGRPLSYQKKRVLVGPVAKKTKTKIKYVRARDPQKNFTFLYTVMRRIALTS